MRGSRLRKDAVLTKLTDKILQNEEEVLDYHITTTAVCTAEEAS